MPALRRSPAPRIVLLGALSSLPHHATPELAEPVWKFDLQGVAQARAEATRGQRFGVTVINPGQAATPEVERDLAQGQRSGGPAVERANLRTRIDRSHDPVNWRKTISARCARSPVRAGLHGGRTAGGSAVPLGEPIGAPNAAANRSRSSA